VDDSAEYVLTEGEILSKSKNTPFIGKQLRGRAVLTMVGGRVVWQRAR